MFSFGSVASILVLFLTEFQHKTKVQAYSFFCAFLSLYFCMSLIGGYVGQKQGYRNAALVGCILMSLGLLLLSIGFYIPIGFAVYVTGCGLLSPNKSVCLSQIFQTKDNSRSSAFTLVYFLMNAGAFSGGALSGIIHRYWGYHSVFFAAGISAFLSGLVFLIYYHRYPFLKNSYCYIQNSQKNNAGRLKIIFLIAILASLLASGLLGDPVYDEVIILVSALIIVLFILYIAFVSDRYGPTESRDVLLFLVLMTLVVMFWSLSDLDPTVVLLFVQDHVDKMVLGYHLSAANFYALDPGFVFLFGFTLYVFFNKNILQKLSSFKKLVIGVTFAVIAMLILAYAMQLATQTKMISFIWIVLIFMFMAMGEILVGPTSKSLVGELAPFGMHGVLMGVVQFVNGLAAIVSGFLATYTSAKIESVTALHVSSGRIRTYALSFIVFTFCVLLVKFFLKKRSPI